MKQPQDQDHLRDDASSQASSSNSRPPSPTSLFQDSLFSLFSHNQPARGDPGDLRTYSHPNLPRKRTQPKSNLKSPSVRYRIAQNDGNSTKLFAHHQWDAGLYLADLIADQSSDNSSPQRSDEAGIVDVRDKSVVELGAGTGLPGLVACLMGATKVVLTDYPDPLVIDNLKKNLDLAICPLDPKQDQCLVSEFYVDSRRRIQVQGLGWGDTQQESLVAGLGGDNDSGFDLVLAADLLWVSSAHPLLIQSIRKLLKRDHAARCVLVAGFHTGRPAVRRFFCMLANSYSAHGEEDMILPDWEAKYGGIWERKIDGSERPWSGGWIPSKAQPRRQTCANTQEGGQQEEQEEEDMGDISDRGSWVVVASLRWANLN